MRRSSILNLASPRRTRSLGGTRHGQRQPTQGSVPRHRHHRLRCPLHRATRSVAFPRPSQPTQPFANDAARRRSRYVVCRWRYSSRTRWHFRHRQGPAENLRPVVFAVPRSYRRRLLGSQGAAGSNGSSGHRRANSVSQCRRFRELTFPQPQRRCAAHGLRGDL